MADRNNGRSDEEMRSVYMGPPMKRKLFGLPEGFLKKKKDIVKKPYPQSFADDGDRDPGPRTERVYAGPRQKEPVLEEVYMGPPPEDEEPEEVSGPAPEEEAPAPAKEAPAFDPRAMEGVYAGPEMMNGPRTMLVYGGPNMRNDPPMAPVYAGPEMMNDPANDPRVRVQEGPRMEALYAAPRRPDPSEMMMVYAGPDFFANQKPQAPMMMAYAGPQFMNMSMAEQMQAAQQQSVAPQDWKKEDFCPNCGAMIVTQGDFCSECGATLPGREKVTCPCCGSLVKKAVFCSECGFLFPKEETESGTGS